jgi:hypothetical protein
MGSVSEEARVLGLTLDQIRTWTPPAKKKAATRKSATGKPRRRKPAPEPEEEEISRQDAKAPSSDSER